REVSGVEPVWIARLGQKLLRLGGVVRGRLERLRELEHSRHEPASRAGQPERLRLVETLTIEGVARGEAHAAVMPWRLRVPLLREIEEGDAGRPRRRQLESPRPLDLLRRRAAQ